MSSDERTVLITGCSNGGVGAELAKEFHRAGLHVYATARDVTKMESLTSLGIETLPLDVQSELSIKECVKKTSKLDILVNNAGATYHMPMTDISLPEAKNIFDLNVWANIALVQAFMPLLLESPKAIIANHTSVGAGMAVPFQSTYNASKAALAMFTDTLRIELQAFNITVVELRTGGVKTNFIKNLAAKQPELPAGSIYAPAKKEAESMLRGDWVGESGIGIPAEQWAKEVVSDLLKKTPPPIIWRGASAAMARYGSFLPSWVFEGMVKRMTGLDKVEAIVRKK